MAASERPNILFIMSDQHRHDYVGCAGAKFIRTPNLDSLAARGVRFTQCCSNAPLCTPARIGLASGLQPSRLGSLDNESFLPRSVTTYYQRLRDAGYRVGCVGKLDLAKPDEYNGRDGDRPCVFGWGFTNPEEIEGKMDAGTSPTPGSTIPMNRSWWQTILFDPIATSAPPPRVRIRSLPPSMPTRRSRELDLLFREVYHAGCGEIPLLERGA